MIRRTLVIALFAAAASPAMAAGQAGSAAATASSEAAPAPAREPLQELTPLAPLLPPLVITDIKVGTGREAVAGDQVYVNYTGWLFDAKAKKQHGKQFDSSVGRPPLTFPLGAGRVIKGWDQGVAGMKVGGKRTLVIPSELAYGPRGAGNGVIPPDAKLIFDVELVSIK
jgi:FKBP-type peptidyl-prolyl cis-trans isomerase FkpA